MTLVILSCILIASRWLEINKSQKNINHKGIYEIYEKMIARHGFSYFVIFENSLIKCNLGCEI